MHRETLLDLLHLCGIPARIIGLLTGLYSGTVSAVKCGGCISNFFPVNTGVRQGCMLAPSLFYSCMDWVLGRVVLADDDPMIFDESLEVLAMDLAALHEKAKSLGVEVFCPRPRFGVWSLTG